MPHQDGTISLELTQKRDDICHAIYFHYYDTSSYNESKYHSVDDFPLNLRQSSYGKNLWVEVISEDHDLIRDVLTYFDVHPFAIDDIKSLEQRMKIAILNDDIYLLLNLIYLNDSSGYIEQQQMKLYLADDVLITVQQYNSKSLFSTIKYRLSRKSIQSRGRLRKMKVDYLFYSFLNTVIENYVSVLEYLLLEIESIDKELLLSTRNRVSAMSVETLSTMFHIKHDLLHFKVVCSPLRDIIIKLQKTRETMIPKRQRSALRQCRRRLKRRMRHGICQTRTISMRSFGQETRNNDETSLTDGVLVFNDYIYKYFKKLLDHTVQLNDSIDSYTDTITSLIDFYMVLNGDWVNNTMQTLTIMSCIFMPLNFLSSLSSMNFRYMPQIPLKFGYFSQLIFMLIVALFMVILFRFKKLL